MARSLNKIQLIGNLGRDPEIRVTPSGTRVASLSVATSREWTDRSGQRQEKTEWHRVSCWDKLAEVCERYLQKGDRVYIEGSVEYSQSEQDGQVRYFTDIRAREMIMLGGRGDRPESTSSPSVQRSAGAGMQDFTDDALAGEDDLPF
ncbi:MAG: single-stranded DNA-binding protein [Candidatus Palauibacterales bacterium]|jgi:single-strand DNA-binding protein|nr:single-stranded DNA-binding protein [Candidatus Palauibacterales bacterium]MDP2481778.1 single-stranded DNA-binding protein [Candidatus Palauibacterales bacterium]